MYKRQLYAYDTRNAFQQFQLRLSRMNLCLQLVIKILYACLLYTSLARRKFNPKERLAIIYDAISQIDGLGVVVIDGIRDLVYDINSPSEATCVISKLMQLSLIHISFSVNHIWSRLKIF